MSTHIVEPNYTIEMLSRIFENLCIAEIKKRIDYHSDVQEGFQNGYIYCLIDLFGSASDEHNEQIFDSGKSYLHVIDNIVASGLQTAINSMQGHTVMIEDFRLINALVSGVVRQYVEENLEEVATAIRSI